MFRDFCHTFFSCWNTHRTQSPESVLAAWNSMPGRRQARSRPKFTGTAIAQALETRIMPAVVVQVDYSLDTSGFFDDSARRTVLEDAINQISTRLDDTLLEIVPGKISPGDTWTATYTNPSTGSVDSMTDLVIGESVIIVFVGARQLGATLGEGGPGGFSVSGSTQAWLDTVAGRGQAGALLPSGSENDFATWGGSLTFDSDTNWHFGLTAAGLDSGESDFYSVAQHEFFHLLGFGTADSWDNLVVGGEFTGAASVAEYDLSGNPPVSGAQSHWQEGTTDGGQEAAMDPTLTTGTRKQVTDLDLAGLDDIGWEVNAGNSGSGNSLKLADGETHTLVISDNGVSGDGISQYVLDGGGVTTFATGSDAFTLTGGDLDDVITVASLDSAFTGTFTINGDAGDDTLTVDYSSRDLITFHGNAGNDALVVQGDPAQTVAHIFTSASDGSVAVDDGLVTSTVVYTGLAPVTDLISATGRSFTFGATADVITLGDDGSTGNGTLQISSVSSSETVDFAMPSGSITVNSGDGADSVTVAALEAGYAGTVVINTEEDADTVDASAAGHAVTVDGGAGNDTITGGSLADNLIGSLGNDVIDGGDGNDTLTGGANRDVLRGGDGDDLVNGNGGSGDRLRGGTGTNTLNGGSGNDFVDELGSVGFTLTPGLLTGPGMNTLLSIEKAVLNGDSGGETFDASASSIPVSVYGAGGDDTISGSSQADLIFGMSGNDLVEGNGGNDSLFGSAGRDVLNGGDGDDSLYGQGGSGDRLTGGPGNDLIDGGAGTDLAVESGDVDFVLTNSSLTGNGNDTLVAIEQASLTTGASPNLISATSYTGLVIVSTGDGDDTVQTGSGFDIISTGLGDDSVDAGLGSDSVLGGGGSDTLNGGGGDDTLSGQGASNDSLFGGSGNDLLLGGSGGDRLFGEEGDDTLRGESGNDILQGGENDDSLLGGTGADLINGGAGNDTLNGGAGNDTLDGDDGDDGLSGFTGDDQLVGDRGSDTLFGGDGNDGLIGASGDDLLIGGADSDFVKGNSGADTLLGGSGAGADAGDNVISDGLDLLDELFSFTTPDWVNAV